MIEDTAGNMWIGTPNGLNKLNPETNQFTHYNNSRKDKNSISKNYIRKVFEDSRQNLWVGSRMGLEVFDRKKKQFIPVGTGPIGYYEINDITEDGEHNIWVATTTGGLLRYDTARKTFTAFTNQDQNSTSLGHN